MKRLINSFIYAWYGLIYFFRNEKNGQIELVAGIIAVFLGFFLKISSQEWLAILLCIGGVISLELVNSALEKLIDHLHPNQHFKIKIVKDMSAAAVAFFALIALIIGCIIFLPKIIHLLIQ